MVAPALTGAPTRAGVQGVGVARVLRVWAHA